MSFSTISHAKPSTTEGRVASLRFGLTAWEAEALKEAAKSGQSTVADIAHEKAAKSIAKIFDNGPLGNVFKQDVRWRGLSLEDMSSRFLTLFGLYIPQGILAVKEQKHPMETNGRNALIWVMTFMLTQFLKNDNFGVNSLLLSPFMIEKGKLIPFSRQADIPADAGFLKRSIHSTFKPLLSSLQGGLNRRFGLTGDYLAVMKDAGLEISSGDQKKALKSIKSPWASMDNNKIDLINNRYEELKKVVSKEGIEALGKLEKPVSQALYETYPKVLRRLNFFPLVSTVLFTAANAYVIGGLAMKLVYKFIAPFDKDFNPAAVQSNKRRSKPPSPPPPPAQLSTPPISPTTAQPSSPSFPATNSGSPFTPPRPTGFVPPTNANTLPGGIPS